MIYYRFIMKSFVLIMVFIVHSYAKEAVNNQKTTNILFEKVVSGVWNYQSSSYSEKGPCPKGKANSGILLISKDGGKFKLTIKSGGTCKPSAVCTYMGDIKNGHLLLDNNVLVDNEGGRTVNRLDIVMSSEKNMTAKSRSQYIHPSGMTCTWLGTMTIFR